MRAPEFWKAGHGGVLSGLLGPAGLVYGWAAKTRFKMSRPARAKLPVLCVGNFVTGGGGKTPAALALHRLLEAHGFTPAFLTRGYGGRLRGPLVVMPGRHGAAEVGDEPLLLARAGPCVVSANRPAGAELAFASAADAVIMDDGLQNPSLAKDVALAVIDSDYGFGNGKVLPAGPLRAPLAFQAGLVDALILTGEGSRTKAVRAFARSRALPVFAAHAMPGDGFGKIVGKRLIAFAGIARPEKFFASLEAYDGEVVEQRAFGDHHPFSEAEARSILAAAERQKALPVTTEKDLARLKGLDGARGALAQKAQALAITLEFEDGEGLWKLIRRKLENRRSA